MARQLVVKYAEMESPIGPLTIVSTPQGICKIEFNQSDAILYSLTRWSKRWLLTDQLEHDPEAHREVFTQIEEYFAGERWQFTVPLDIQGTEFQRMVWSELLQIPYGDTRSYKDIAMGIGAPKAVRAIGGANNKNPIPIIIPCHRVIGSNGALVGYGAGLDIKEFLLKLEYDQIMAEQAR